MFCVVHQTHNRRIEGEGCPYKQTKIVEGIEMHVEVVCQSRGYCFAEAKRPTEKINRRFERVFRMNGSFVSGD